ncbi:MAG: hypothetical protein HYR91_02970 [Flavobacteriia bacterium]|nr:hypothetical protein [Flavobacteriia bacterium]
MKLEISERIQIIIDSKKSNINDFYLEKMYVEATDKYNELIKLGLTKPRGNNLISKEKALSSSFIFNR